MRERPILFSAPMVCALLAGRKTQTRRVVRPQCRADDAGMLCRYGTIGDRLWVRETWCRLQDVRTGDPGTLALSCGAFHSADYPSGLDHDDGSPVRWRPSIFMPRWASRFTLEITDVRVQRVHDITEENARAEGVVSLGVGASRDLSLSYRASYAALWDTLNVKRWYGWNANPWVWAITFRCIQ